MPGTPKIEFGYNPPSGDRGKETIRPDEYLSDLEKALDVATQGFDSIWVSDHLNYASEWRLECWTLLTRIAARYPDVCLSTIVMNSAFQNPALMAKMAASLQVLSGGRFTLGYGAGWHKGEHEAFGFDYPRSGERVYRLEESIQVIRALWTDSPGSFSGRYYSIDGAHSEPRADPVPKIMIGASGEKKSLRVVAKYADWWNDVARPLPELQHKLDVLRTHCDEVGRDFNSIRKTLPIGTFINKQHSRALDQAGLSNQNGKASGGRPLYNSDTIGVAGDPSAVREQYHELREMGFDLIVTYLEDLHDLTQMKLFMDEVIPEFS